MNDDDLWREFKRRFIEGNRTPVDDLFKEQKLVACDPARFRFAQTSRRAGKSVTASAILTEGAATPGSQNPYIALTRESARRIIWPTLKNLIRRHRYKCDAVESSLTFKFDNDAEVFLVGADQSNFIDRLRGLKIKQCAIDEAQGFKAHLQELVDDVITPALIDFGGQVTLFGTPHPRRSGFFYDICHQNIPGWSGHHWTLLQNPHLKDVSKFLVELKEKRGWDDDNATFQREYLNLWVKDEDSLLFKFSRDKNVYSVIPGTMPIQTIMGIDFGFNDKCAFVVLGENHNHRKTYALYSWSKAGMIVSEIAEKVKELISIYAPVKIVADTGGLGKTIAEEMRRRYQIPIEAADKPDKASRIAICNDEFRSGNFMIHNSNQTLIDELETIVKDQERLIEEDGQVCDEADAMLYAFSESKAYAFTLKEPVLDRNTDAFMLKQLELESEGMQNREWWEMDS